MLHAKSAQPGHEEDVSILTRPEERVLRNVGDRRSSSLGFQSSPALKSGCYRCVADRDNSRCSVSILTRPEERVLLTASTLPPTVSKVSILTRPEERVLRPYDCMLLDIIMFQSSPALKSGCYNTC